jgi:hypothetical protein
MNMYCQTTTQDCECSSSAGRRFLTADEKIARLNEYRDWLTSEAKGVEEAIERIKKRE